MSWCLATQMLGLSGSCGSTTRSSDASCSAPWRHSLPCSCYGLHRIEGFHGALRHELYEKTHAQGVEGSQRPKACTKEWTKSPLLENGPSTAPVQPRLGDRSRHCPASPLSWYTCPHGLQVSRRVRKCGHSGQMPVWGRTSPHCWTELISAISLWLTLAWPQDYYDRVGDCSFCLVPKGVLHQAIRAVCSGELQALATPTGASLSLSLQARRL